MQAQLLKGKLACAFEQRKTSSTFVPVQKLDYENLLSKYAVGLAGDADAPSLE